MAAAIIAFMEASRALGTSAFAGLLSPKLCYRFNLEYIEALTAAYVANGRIPNAVRGVRDFHAPAAAALRPDAPRRKVGGLLLHCNTSQFATIGEVDNGAGPGVPFPLKGFTDTQIEAQLAVTDGAPPTYYKNPKGYRGHLPFPISPPHPTPPRRCVAGGSFPGCLPCEQR